ncbi:MAG TPA: ATP--guanido phosphotransferase [Opitutae bacterium]|nr:ATP--guanido phosphotransferase [Opitutae bacterium]
MFHDLFSNQSKAKRTPKSIPVTLSTRIRLARNLREFPFPGRAETSQKRAVLTKCMDALSEVKGLDDSFSVEVDDLSELDRQVLVEKHLISPELSQVEEGSGIVLSEDRNCCIMINEEDHLRIQVLRPGLDFGTVWKRVDALDSGIESTVGYAYDGELGFLTACPTNLGTGMRASAMMHLPGLVMSKNMDKVINAVNQLGIAVRGLFGEGSDANGSIFQISNQQTLGESETAIIERLDNTLQNIVRQENFAREKLLQDDGTRLIDKMSRAIGNLKTCHLIQSSEAMDYLSLVRLASDFGMMPEKFRTLSDRMFIEVQPGHVQLSAGKPVDPALRDALRAELLRKEFLRAPHLDPSPAAG